MDAILAIIHQSIIIWYTDLAKAKSEALVSQILINKKIKSCTAERRRQWERQQNQKI